MMEAWVDIDGWEGYYQVSSLGRVRSLDRVVPYGRFGEMTIRGRVLSVKRGATSKNRYPTVRLSRKGKHTAKTVHGLVARAFVPNPNGYPLVRHLNDDPRDNKETNLQWGTGKQNMNDKRCPHCGKNLAEGYKK